MFTVCHREGNGNEMLYTADHVQFVPAFEENGNVAGVHLLSGPSDAPHGVHCGQLIGGQVFVMNEKGATIARYYLEDNSKLKGVKGIAA